MKRGEDNPVSNTLLRESTLKSISYLQSKVYLQEKEVYELVRAFWKEYLGLDYEFTHDELLIELQNVFYDKSIEDKVLLFLRKVSRVEYSDDEFSSEQLKALLEEFAKLVDTLIRIKRQEKTFMQKLMFWKGMQSQEVPAEKEEEEEIAEVIEDLEKKAAVDEKQDLFDDNARPIHNERIPDEEPEVKDAEVPKTSNRLAQLSAEINQDVPKVQHKVPRMQELLNVFSSNKDADSYSKLIAHYESLTEEEKAKYYDAVVNAYNLIKSLSSSKENS